MFLVGCIRLFQLRIFDTVSGVLHSFLVDLIFFVIFSESHHSGSKYNLYVTILATESVFCSESIAGMVHCVPEQCVLFFKG